MGVVNAPIDHEPRLPTKSCLALGTPHLVASVNLVDPCRARRARFRFFAQHFCRGHIFGQTGVFFALDLETGGTGIDAA